MSIGVFCVDRQIRGHMGECGEREDEKKFAPYFGPRKKADQSECGVNWNGIKPCDQVLHGGLEIKLLPHFRTGYIPDELLVGRPKKDSEIGNERTKKNSKIMFAIFAFRKCGKGKEAMRWGVHIRALDQHRARRKSPPRSREEVSFIMLILKYFRERPNVA